MQAGCCPAAAPGSNGDRAETPGTLAPTRSANDHSEAQAPTAGTWLGTAGGKVKEHC